MRADIAIYNLLKDSSNIYPVVIPQRINISDGSVYLAYNVINTQSITSKTSFNDYDRVTVQISFFSSDMNAVLTKADAVRTVLDRYSGTITINLTDYKVDLIRFENQEIVGFDEDLEIFMIAADYSVAMYQ